MAAEPGLTLTIYAAEPASKSEEALRLLASWAAARDVEALPTCHRHGNRRPLTPVAGWPALAKQL